MKVINLQKNISFINYTTIKAGGYSEYFSEPKNITELINTIKWAKYKNIECQIIGAGSNLLTKNAFLKGLTICTKKIKGMKINPSTGFVEAECGTMLPALSNLLAKNRCMGGEWIIGIPGTVGGAIFMNAGSGHFSISENLSSVKAIDKKTLKIIKLSKKDLIFNYRFSPFQNNNLIILSASFSFQPDGDSKLIAAITRKNLNIKTKSQPYHMPSFGSVFKNPKNLFAGKLIEEIGLKGFKLGGAQVSTMHANFIVNNSNASSNDIYQLITLIQQKVQQKKGIFLHPEVRMIGF